MERKESAAMRPGSRFARRLAAAGLFGLLGLATITAYSMLNASTGVVRVAPISLLVNSASSLPPEVRALETETAAWLFDRDTGTNHVGYADQSITVNLDRPTEIRSIKLYGAAPYELTVLAQQGSSWNEIPGLSKLKLSNLTQDWNEFSATQSVTAQALRFELTLTAKGHGAAASPTAKGHGAAAGPKTTATTATTGGIAEIEIWGKGDHSLVSGAALVTAMQAPSDAASSPQPTQARSYNATPDNAGVGKDGQRLTVTLDRPAASFKRAWLSYEAFGLAHWVSPVRRINGLALQGGAFTFTSREWTTLVEPLQPDWLATGSNQIEFTLPANTGGTYSVRNVKIVGELDDGNNFIQRATSTVGGVENDTPALTDGDASSGWSPYADPRSKTGDRNLTLYFDRTTQLDSLSLNLANSLNGTLSIDLLVDGQWQNGGLQSINGRKLTAGWNNLNGFAKLPADALRITFLNGSGSPAEIREISAAGSGSGSRYVPDIHVAFPDNGQFYGREAYLRGFLTAVDNGSGRATLSIGGKTVPMTDGSFGVVVNKDDVGFANQADGEPWQVQLDAEYPDGKKVSRIVKLSHANDASKAHGLLPSVANPGFAALLDTGDASLDIGPDDLDKASILKITPLADRDLPPLDPGMTNVTPSPNRGYRFTPHGTKFKKPIKVTIPYDPTLIPTGLTKNDVKTYYFDTERGHWEELTRFQIDANKRKVTSLTTHFTDMINATLTVPDHPEAVSYNATQMKDIKAADPGAGVNLIEPPKPNNMGDARLSYPIEIPQGRQGMQPQLAISYSSGGGNGWLGLGWDLSVPSISIDTRWGVPRYDAGQETETYTLGGEQLTPLAHRGPLVARSSEKIFHTRIEGQFRKIIRHGDSPTSYWWEVIDKNGTSNFYGGVGTAQDASSVIGSGKGVFKWALRQTRDPHGNTVNYSYAKVDATGSACASPVGVAGCQIYIKQIDYTGQGSSNGAGPYTVDFIRARDLGETRPDVTIDARGGFKQVTADKLRKIKVKYAGNPVRSYELKYQEGAFAKSLLTSVDQYGADDVLFNSHVFGYYDDIRSADLKYQGFASPKEVATGTDHLEFNSIGGKFPHTVIGGSEGKSQGLDGYVGIGVAGAKNVSVGVGFGASRSKSKGSNVLADVDGDGLPDKVFIKGGAAFYRPNTTASGALDQVGFSAAEGGGRPIANFSPPSESESSTSNFGVQAFVFGLTGNGGRAVTTTRDMSYLADINGDGLVDIVSRGSVKFNSAKNTGVAGFSMNSYDTETPLGNLGGSVNNAILPDVSEDRTRLENENPLMDNVRRWLAPYDGVVKISGGVRLVDIATDPRFTSVEQEDRRNYKQADGVRVAIQRNSEPELWGASIPATDYSEHTPTKVETVSVKKGDRIHFRVNSVYDGDYDQVAWSPKVEYVDGSVAKSYLDVNNLNAYLFQAGEDFVFAGRPVEMTVPYRGTLRLSGLLNKTAITTDDVTVRVTVTDRVFNPNGTVTSGTPKVVVSKKLAWDMVGLATLQDDFPVGRFSGVKIDLVVDSPIDLSTLKWGDLASSVVPRPGQPLVYYTEAYQEEEHPLAPESITPADSVPTNADSIKPSGTAGMTPILDEDGNPIVIEAKRLDVYDAAGQPIYKIPAKYDADIYAQDHLTAPQQKSWVAPKDGFILLTPWIKLKTYPQLDSQSGKTLYVAHVPDGSVVITAKRRSVRLAKQEILIKDGQVVDTTQGYSGVQVFQVKAGDEIFLDASMRDPLIENELAASAVDIHYASDTPWQAPLTGDVDFVAHVQGSAPTPDLGDPNAVPVDSRAMLVIRRGSGEIAFKQIVNFATTPVIDLSYAGHVLAGEKWYFDLFTIESNVHAQVNQAWAAYKAPSSWTAPYAGSFSFSPVLNFASGVPDGNVTLAILQNGVSVAQRTYSIKNGAVVLGGNPPVLDVSAGQTLAFAFSTDNYPLSSYLLDKGSVSVDYLSAANPADLVNWTKQVVGSSSFTIAMPTMFAYQTPQDGVTSHYPLNDPLFGNPYRGWATAAYNGGSGALAMQPIAESKFALSSNESDYKDPNYSHTAWFAYPEVESGRWSSLDDKWWTSPAEVSASRKGLDNVYDPRKDDFTDTRSAGYAGASRPPRMAKIKQKTSGFGFVLSKTQANGDSASQMEILDMNGDRFPDVVSPSGTQYTWADGTFYDSNGGAGPARGSLDSQTTIGLSVGVPTSKQSAGAQISGTGDKKSGETSSVSIGGGVSKGSSNVKYDLIDVNGDGLPDRVTATGSGLTVQINTGYGFEAPETWTGGQLTLGTSKGKSANVGFSSWNGVFGGGVSVSEGHNYTNTTLMDINGDGLPDVVSVGGDGKLAVLLNTGSGFAETAIEWPGALKPYKSLKDKTPGPMAVSDGASSTASGSAKVGFGFQVWFLTISFSVGINVGETVSQPSIAFNDINGDGFVDGLITANDSEMTVALNPINRTNLLKEVQRPLGVAITLDYQRIGNTYAMPQSRLVMSKLLVNDGHADDGVDVQKTTYRYDGGNYNRLERDFYGFKTVVEEHRDIAQNDAIYRSATHTYLNDNYYDKGLLASETTVGGPDQLYLETRNTYRLRDIGTGSEAAANDPVFGNSITATLFPMLTRAERNFYEGASPASAPGKTTSTSHEYDAYGNVTHFVDAGDSGSEDDVEALINYSTACTDSYAVGLATRIDVIAQGQLMRSREGTIDCATGDLTQLSQSLENGDAAVTDLTYYPNGNLKTVTGPANHKGQRYALDYEYDEAVATHVTRIGDSFGYTSSAVHDYRFGKPLSTTDLNGNVISTTYDSFGRTTAIHGPYEQPAGEDNATLSFAYYPEMTTAGAQGTVPHAITWHRNLDAQGDVQPPIETVLFTDGLKRVLQTKKSAAIDGQPMIIVSGRVVFDAFGRSIEQYYPVSEPLGQEGSFNPAFDSVAPTRTEYDVLDRPLKTTLPDATSTRIAYGFGADGSATQFRTTVTDANGQQKESFRDIRELITAVKETNNNQDLWTRYAYDPLKQITQVIDARGNTTRIAYDNLGRRTRIDNPDTGATETVYDLAGNPTQKITAVLKLQGQAVSYDYDFRRLAAIDYPHNKANNVAYTYGANTPEAKQHNQVGRITQVTHQAGSDERQYGKLGETVRETRTVASGTQGNSANSPEIYTTQYAYDTFGRILTVNLPDGETVTHRYDAGGNLEHIEGERQGEITPYLHTLHYDKFEQRTWLKHGNGVDTRYTYDGANRRLNNLNSTGTVAGRFQNLNYGYDKVGNILSLANDIQVPPPNTFGGPTKHTYGYDDLYRLTSAKGRYQSSPSKVRDYTLAMGYDSIHNIITKTQLDTLSSSGSNAIQQKGTTYDWAYAYGGPQPHAPTHIGNRTFFHDANGNQTGWTDDKNGNRRDIEWDEDNRIQSIADNGSTSRYKYDDGGQRVFKTGKQGETVYVNQYYVVRNRSIVSKHVFAGSARVATKLETGNGNTGNVRGSGTATGGSVGTTQSPGTTSTSGSKGQGNAYAYGHDKDQGNSATAAANDKGNKGGQGKGNNAPGRNPDESATNLPGNSEAGLENALSRGQGNKYGIYKRLDKLGLEVDVTGEIVPEGTGETPPEPEPVPETGSVQPSLFLYYYHPDHLGSTGYVTAADGKLYEHLEYFPFGETWVQEHSNIQRTPYLYTGKELDEDTQLYYFGARYYDPRTSVWQSADPILGKYLPTANVGHDNLPGMGGVSNPMNMGLYGYGHHNPIRYVDPNGEFAMQAAGGIVGAVVGLGFQLGLDAYHGKLSSGAEYAGAIVGGAAGGVAATVCGPACAGAAAGAASNATTQVLSGGDVSVGSFAADTALGAVGGKVAGTVVPAAFKELVSNTTKGKTGEGLTALGLMATGQKVAQRPAPNNVGKSTFDFKTSTGKFVESKFGTSDLSKQQRVARKQQGANLELHKWDYSTVSGLGAAGSAGTAGKNE